MEESGLKRLSKILDIFTGLVIQLKKKIGSLLLIFTFGHVDKKKSSWYAIRVYRILYVVSMICL